MLIVIGKPNNKDIRLNHKNTQYKQKRNHMLISHNYEKLRLKAERYLINLFLNAQKIEKKHVFEQSITHVQKNN